MPDKRTQSQNYKPSRLQFSDESVALGPRKYDRDEVLQYVEEMCATLAFMSRTHECPELSALLQIAATEANRARSTCHSEQSCEILSVHGDLRDTK